MLMGAAVDAHREQAAADRWQSAMTAISCP
jgi:hypothetical protein